MLCGTPQHLEEAVREGGTCNCSYGQFENRHESEFIPSGTQKLRIFSNVILMQNSNGKGNFRLSDPEEAQFLQDVYTRANSILANLDYSNVQCNKAHVSDIRLEIVPNFIEIRDDVLWDCEQDPTPLSTNWNSDYLQAIDALAAQTPGYQDGFNVVISNEADAYYAYSPGGNVALWNLPEYSNHYNGYWYSGFPRCSDLSSKARWHAPNMYLWWINAKDHVHPFGQVASDNFMEYAARVFLHEYGHFLGLPHINDPDNIMKSGGDADDVALTTCQAEEMFESLMLKNVRKYVTCEAGLDHEIVVNEDEVWTMDLRAYSDIRVASGATLEIKCRVEMAPDTRIEVEEGAQLIVNGAELTSCGEWRGITTSGGRSDFDVKVHNGAVIEHTKTSAISMYHPYGGWLLGSGNATVIIDNATFFECKRMLAMGAAVLSFNSSSITNSTQDGGKHGITNWNCLNVKVDNNLFRGQSNDCIHGIDCSFYSITGNEFYSEDIDVWILESFPGYGSNVVGNKFYAANVGMHLAGGSVGSYTIEDNSFNATSIDLFIDNHASYQVDGNDFSADIGFVSASNGNAFNDVNQNDFVSNSVGILPFGSNDGYVFRNNCFDTYLVDANISDKVFEVQSDATNPASNCFTHQGVLGVVPDIDGSMSHFAYRVPEDDIKNCYDALNPANYSVEEGGSVSRSPCGSSFSGPAVRYNPCDFTDRQDEIERNIKVLNERIGSVLNNPLLSDAQKERLIAIYKRCLDRNQRMRIRLLVGDEKYQEAIEAYKAMKPSLDRDVALFGVLVLKGDLDAAATLLQSIDRSSALGQDFVMIQEVNLARLRGGREFAASGTVIEAVRSIAMKHHPYSAYAKGLLYILTGEFMRSPIPVYSPDRQSSLRHSVPSTTTSGVFAVFPNPFRDDIEVAVPQGKDKSYTYTVTDIFGRVYFDDVALETPRIDMRALQQGVYVLMIKSGDEIMHSQKVVKF